MCRKAGIIETERPEIEVAFAQNLNHVAVRCQPGVPGDAHHLFNRLQDTGFVVGAHHRNKRALALPVGNGFDRLLQRRKVDPSVAVNADHRRAGRRLKNGVMLNGTGDDTVKGRQDKIVGLGAAAGEHHIRGPAARQHRYLGARCLDNHACLPPEGMDR